jgi:hypothetical protein
MEKIMSKTRHTPNLDNLDYSSAKDTLQDADLAAMTGGATVKDPDIASAVLAAVAHMLCRGAP